MMVWFGPNRSGHVVLRRDGEAFEHRRLARTDGGHAATWVVSFGERYIARHLKLGDCLTRQKFRASRPFTVWRLEDPRVFVSGEE